MSDEERGYNDVSHLEVTRLLIDMQCICMDVHVQQSLITIISKKKILMQTSVSLNCGYNLYTLCLIVFYFHIKSSLKSL